MPSLPISEINQNDEYDEWPYEETEILQLVKKNRSKLPQCLKYLYYPGDKFGMAKALLEMEALIHYRDDEEYINSLSEDEYSFRSELSNACFSDIEDIYDKYGSAQISWLCELVKEVKRKQNELEDEARAKINKIKTGGFFSKLFS